jgi:hypothetical protein
MMPFVPAAMMHSAVLAPVVLAAMMHSAVRAPAVLAAMVLTAVVLAAIAIRTTFPVVMRHPRILAMRAALSTFLFAVRTTMFAMGMRRCLP